MIDRRAGQDRRHRHLIPEPLERRRERRGAERRDSPRREIALDVREPGRPARSCQGDLSLGGVAFVTAAPPAGDAVELLFSVPTYVGPIAARGTVVSRRKVKKGTQLGVLFTDIDVEAELAIAEWFEAPGLTAAARH